MWGWPKPKPLASLRTNDAVFQETEADRIPAGGRDQPPDWASRLPAAVTFVDVETTGFHSKDRIVSLGAIRLLTEPLKAGQIEVTYLHLVFDPGRKSHPKAEQVHGYSDWLLRHQDPFAEHAEQIWKFIHRASVIVAHNAEFDGTFINREMVAAGCPPINRPLYCTMEGYRALGLGGSASLDALCRRMNLVRRGRRHGALEDAWLAMQVYLWLHDCPHRAGLPEGEGAVPVNLRPSPPVPEGRLPPRRRSKRSPAP